MPAFIAHAVFDQGLVLIQNCNLLHLNTAIPTSYQDVTATSLGSKAMTPGAPIPGVPDGRQVNIPAVSDLAGASGGTATAFSIIDTVAGVYYVGQLLESPITIVQGQNYNVTSSVVRIPDPVT